MSIEAMKQALDALESDNPDIQLRAAIALRQAIEQAEQKTAVSPDPDDPGVTPLYTAPVDGVTISEERVDETAERKHMTDLASVGEVGVWGEREWVGLTDEEADELVRRFARYELLREIEAKLKEKNT